MCNCRSMVRDAMSELEGREKWIPLSDHHPKCEDYKLVKYAKITHGAGGSGLITEPDMVEGFIQGEVEGGASAEDFQVTDVFMTQDQYENLQEFDGF